jgi:hypothetical protein
MAASLRLVTGEGCVELESAPFRLHAEARRPGLAHETLAVPVRAPLLAGLARAAARDGMPLALWACLAVESERALEAVAPSSRRGAAAAALDSAALPDRLATAGGTRLQAYAEALRERSPGEPEPGGDGRLRLFVPYHSLSAWRRAARDDEAGLEAWVRARLARLPAGRHRWEAAAAERGETLGEWVAMSLARS